MNPLAVADPAGPALAVGVEHRSAPSEAIGEPALLLVPLAIFVLVVVASVLLFRKKAPRIAEEL